MNRRAKAAPPRVRDVLDRRNVLLQAEINGRADVLGILVELLEKSGAVTNGPAFYQAVCEREDIGGSTAIGEGIALPHAAGAGVARPAIAAVVLRHPVDWGAGDGRPVDLFFLLAVPPGAHSTHLQLLARLVNLLSCRDLPDRLRRESSRASFVTTLTNAEAGRFA